MFFRVCVGFYMKCRGSTVDVKMCVILTSMWEVRGRTWVSS